MFVHVHALHRRTRYNMGDLRVRGPCMQMMPDTRACTPQMVSAVRSRRLDHLRARSRSWILQSNARNVHAKLLRLFSGADEKGHRSQEEQTAREAMHEHTPLTVSTVPGLSCSKKTPPVCEPLKLVHST